jgi:hypothetical protein
MEVRVPRDDGLSLLRQLVARRRPVRPTAAQHVERRLDGIAVRAVPLRRRKHPWCPAEATAHVLLALAGEDLERRGGERDLARRRWIRRDQAALNRPAEEQARDGQQAVAGDSPRDPVEHSKDVRAADLREFQRAESWEDAHVDV